LHIQLQRQGRSYSFDSAGKTAHGAIAPEVQYTTVMCGYFFFQLFLQFVPELHRRCLIFLHHSCVSDNIGKHDGGELAGG
jgi:hypothetical protein